MSVLTKPSAADRTADLQGLLDDESLRSVYQPVVSLYEPGVVGYEALVRGPVGSDLEPPDKLFAAARAAGLTAALDMACRKSALEGALSAGLRFPSTLFLNVEAAALSTRLPPTLVSLIRRAMSSFRVVVEVTERALTDRPAELFKSLAELRQLGCGIALDDVGADERSLALMPFLRPDVIKLDLRFVQDKPSAALARVHNAVAAEAERTGAVVLAEGIESEEHLLTARALGATLGQGYLFGRPAPLDSPARFGGGAVPVLGAIPGANATSPFELVSAVRPLRRGRSKPLLLATSRELEHQAMNLGVEGVLLSTFQESRHLSPATMRLYSDLARQITFVGALGSGVSVEPAPGVRGAELADDDPVRAEWDVIVIGIHFGAAFVARDLGDRGADDHRRFDFTITYARDTAVAAARSLMGRIAPA